MCVYMYTYIHISCGLQPFSEQHTRGPVQTILIVYYAMIAIQCNIMSHTMIILYIII